MQLTGSVVIPILKDAGYIKSFDVVPVVSFDEAITADASPEAPAEASAPGLETPVTPEPVEEPDTTR